MPEPMDYGGHKIDFTGHSLVLIMTNGASIDLQTLPDEMLIYVATFLHDNQSRGAFARVCCRFHMAWHTTYLTKDQHSGMRAGVDTTTS